MLIHTMNPSKKSRSDNSFSSFAIGVSVGVAAAFLFGTDDGRKLVKKVVDSLPEKYKKIPEETVPYTDNQTENYSTQHPVLDIPLQETPHHSTYNFEAPPPAPPHVRPSRPEPFLHS
jgi:hypothetical protein